MKIQEVREKAKNMGIKTSGMRKTDLIRTIQRVENNIECYATERIGSCEEHSCLWRDDCLSLLNIMNSQTQGRQASDYR